MARVSQAAINAVNLRVRYKIAKDLECASQNGEGSTFNLSTGNCEGP
jgi:hypothetical protein